jgi:elongation factor 1-beta
MPSFGDLSTPAGLDQLNSYLANRSYVEGWNPSQEDVTVFNQVAHTVDCGKFPHVGRWYNHIASFSACQRKRFSGAGSCGSCTEEKKEVKGGAKEEKSGKKDKQQQKKEEPKQKDSKKDNKKDNKKGKDEPAKKEEPKPEVKKEGKTQEELDIEAYMIAMSQAGDEDEDDDGPVVEQAPASGKPKKAAVSNVTLDVMPDDVERDLKKMEADVRGIRMKGLNWQGCKVEPVAFGLCKLRITGVIEDDVVQVSDLESCVKGVEGVQSVEVLEITNM